MRNKRTKSLISGSCSDVLLGDPLRPPLEEYWLLPDVHFSPAEESNTGVIGIRRGRLSGLQSDRRGVLLLQPPTVQSS